MPSTCSFVTLLIHRLIELGMIGAGSSRNRRASSTSEGSDTTRAVSVSGAAYGGYARKQVCAVLSRLPQGCTKVCIMPCKH
jgi:hypothetical protein